MQDLFDISGKVALATGGSLGIGEMIAEGIVAGATLKRAGRAEDMAGVAIYLASKAASFVTGVVIPVDRGLTGAKGTL